MPKHPESYEKSPKAAAKLSFLGNILGDYRRFFIFIL